MAAAAETSDATVGGTSMATKASGNASALPHRVLFARVGRMVYYAGPVEGDERPRGGGGYNARNLGHEVFNFAQFKHRQFKNRLYGFIQPSNRKKKAINLQRIDPTIPANADRAEGVLIIFVTRYKEGQKIIGWYRNATVFRTRVPLPTTIQREINERLLQTKVKYSSFTDYTVDAPVSDAKLLPTSERLKAITIPGHVPGSFGQSNVCYVYEQGERKNAPWMEKAIEFVQSYAKEDLLKRPDAETGSEELAIIAQEQAAGFQSNVLIRLAIEEYAMQMARRVLQKNDYKRIIDTASIECYDYTCDKNGERYYVEVKGTQTKGGSIILTHGEADHAIANASNSILVLIHSVKVSRTGHKQFRVSKGEVIMHQSWKVRRRDLEPIQYTWKVPQSAAN
jgi:Domain of unknown function (DUF3883)